MANNDEFSKKLKNAVDEDKKEAKDQFGKAAEKHKKLAESKNDDMEERVTDFYTSDKGE